MALELPLSLIDRRQCMEPACNWETKQWVWKQGNGFGNRAMALFDRSLDRRLAVFREGAALSRKTTCLPIRHVSPRKAIDVYSADRRTRPALWQYAARAVRRGQRRARRGHAVFNPGPELRRSRAQGSSDGHRNGGTQPPGSGGNPGPHALETAENRSPGGACRSTDRHCGRGRCRLVQFDGGCLDG